MRLSNPCLLRETNMPSKSMCLHDGASRGPKTGKESLQLHDAWLVRVPNMGSC